MNHLTSPGIQREEQKTVKALKDAAKKGDQASVKVLGGALYESKKAIKRIYVAKANLKVVENQMHQTACKSKCFFFHSNSVYCPQLVCYCMGSIFWVIQLLILNLTVQN